MKALTLYQPWATLVALGAKRLETRSWSTSYRGPLVIHAALHFPPNHRRLCNEYAFQAALRVPGSPARWRFRPPTHWPTTGFHTYAGGLPLGAAVAIVTLVDCSTTEWLTSAGAALDAVWDDALTDREHAFGDYSPGRYAWLLRDVRPLKPVPMPGARRIWTVQPELEPAITLGGGTHVASA